MSPSFILLLNISANLREESTEQIYGILRSKINYYGAPLTRTLLPTWLITGITCSAFQSTESSIVYHSNSDDKSGLGPSAVI